jgi:sulfate adenylyltransferase subunit 2
MFDVPTSSPVAFPDGRNIAVAELNDRRIEAVRLRLGGASIAQAAATAGLSRPTVIRAFKAFQAGGWDAVPVASRGRQPRLATAAPRPAPHAAPDLTAQVVPGGSLTHLERLEAQSIHILREAVAEAEHPVMLYSIGKDSSVLLHLALKAFHPSRPPFPLLHVDTTWKFREMYAFRDETAARLGLELIVHVNEEGLREGVNPFTHGSAIHTDVMKTQALRQALDRHHFDVAFAGARRDEEASRAKERVFSFRSASHRWDPKSQRPELWELYNTRKRRGESIRVFPLSNWTEPDVWQYIYVEQIPIVPLYFAAERPVVQRDEMLLLVDDDRLPLEPGEQPRLRKVRFRTLGCYPLTGAIQSEAETLPEIVYEMLVARTSERQGRLIDHDGSGSMERKKQEGYF